MKFAITSMAALLAGTAPLLAGGIERAPQSLNILFEQGNYAELSFGAADPTVEGTDTGLPPSVVPPVGLAPRGTGDVANGYGFLGLGYKHQFNEALSAALIVEQPFGADVSYQSFTPPSDGGSSLLGGTMARVDSTTFTALLRYKMPNNFSVHGGIRGSRADAEVSLSGFGYGGLSGYNVQLDQDWGAGYVIGAAYEIPDIAARVSLTYNSKVEHKFDTVESLNGAPLGESTTTVDTPESVTLEAQTGIAADTLLFGSIRWVNWSEFLVDPAVFTALSGGGLVSLEDTTTYTLGVGRKFNETWSGSAALTYEPENDDLVSPLAPTNGRVGLTLAAVYTMDNMKITTGINYSKLGDARPQTGGAPRAQMEDSDILGIGVRIGYSF
ncbi:OmpP1/FadL family transporter [Paracoccus sp. PAMC 22219]|uniref:OmpP1/FadL family transporter n=1 Tax=Paracoccus sp. PAMC 22219 TaxID=1569209 RepID=UPI0005A9A0C9|nr:outer membrane protein transport protein [Paracoccus sp. PAMC 22219]